MPSASTGKKRGKRIDLAVWLARVRPAKIAETEFAEPCRDLAPVSESYLKKLLRESGVPLAPTVGGVRQSNLAYRTSVRRIVIAAKDRAPWASWKRPKKQEMVLWMNIWLENPPVFPQRVKLSRAQ